LDAKRHRLSFYIYRAAFWVGCHLETASQPTGPGLGSRPNPPPSQRPNLTTVPTPGGRWDAILQPNLALWPNWPNRPNETHQKTPSFRCEGVGPPRRSV